MFISVLFLLYLFVMFYSKRVGSKIKKKILRQFIFWHTVFGLSS